MDALKRSATMIFVPCQRYPPPLVRPADPPGCIGLEAYVRGREATRLYPTMPRTLFTQPRVAQSDYDPTQPKRTNQSSLIGLNPAILLRRDEYRL